MASLAQHRYKIYDISNLSRKMCFDVRRNSICGDSRLSISALRFEIHKHNGSPDGGELTYPFFEIDENGMACVVFDDSINDLPLGRYVAKLFADCYQFDEIHLRIGSRPVVADPVIMVTSSRTDCLNSLGEMIDSESLIEPEDPQCADTTKITEC